MVEIFTLSFEKKSSSNPNRAVRGGAASRLQDRVSGRLSDSVFDVRSDLCELRAFGKLDLSGETVFSSVDK